MRRSGSILDETKLAAGNLGGRRRRRGARELRSRKPQRRWWRRVGEWRCAGAAEALVPESSFITQIGRAHV